MKVGPCVKIEPNTPISNSWLRVGKDEGHEEGGRRKGCDGGMAVSSSWLRNGYKTETRDKIDETELIKKT